MNTHHDLISLLSDFTAGGMTFLENRLPLFRIRVEQSAGIPKDLRCDKLHPDG